jgi:hypothetical protein
MRKLQAAVFLLFLGSVPLMWAGEGASPQPRQVRLLGSVVMAPLSPSLSVLSLELPFAALPLGRPGSRAGASVWVLSDSPYLIPRSYLEVGLVLDWALINAPRHILTAGLGTAMGIQTVRGGVSVPFVVKATYRWSALGWLSLEAGTEALLYSAGAGFDIRLRALTRPFAAGLLLGLGVGYGMLSEWDFNPHGDALQLEATGGYSWPGSREGGR